ncbi:hypothetical protein BH10PSE3_BH10PSE3_09390 [soil metagenome]
MVVTRRIWSTALAMMLFAAPLAAWAQAPTTKPPAVAPAVGAPFDARLSAAKAAMMGDPQTALALQAATLEADCQAAGADDVIRKPVNLATLFETIGDLIARRGQGDQVV